MGKCSTSGFVQIIMRAVCCVYESIRRLLNFCRDCWVCGLLRACSGMHYTAALHHHTWWYLVYCTADAYKIWEMNFPRRYDSMFLFIIIIIIISFVQHHFSVWNYRIQCVFYMQRPFCNWNVRLTEIADLMTLSIKLNRLINSYENYNKRAIVTVLKEIRKWNYYQINMNRADGGGGGGE